MNPLQQLLEYGQSHWLDNLTRGLIRSGELARRISEQGLRGVTSNPAIFHQAISKGEGDDEQIRGLKRESGLKVPPRVFGADAAVRVSRRSPGEAND